MIKDYSGIHPASLEEHLKMQVLSSGPASTACESNHLASLYFISYLHKVLRLVAVQCLKTVCVPYTDAVAIAIVWP